MRDDTRLAALYRRLAETFVEIATVLEGDAQPALKPAPRVELPLSVRKLIRDHQPMAWPEVEGVYFVRCGSRIKIGYSRNIKSRLDGMATSMPTEPHLMAWMPGDAEAEKALHQRFARHRKRREWFSCDPELIAYIQLVRAQRHAARKRSRGDG